MADIAELGIIVETNAGVAASQLDQLAVAAGRAESAAQRLKRAHDEQTKSARQAMAGTTNLAAQFQDIFVSLQGGQMPLTVALQQGSQIAPIFQQGVNAVTLLRSAFMSLAASLPIIAGIAAAGYAFQWLTGAGEKTKKLNELLSEQADILKSLGTAYAGAASSADKLFDRSSQAGFGIGAQSSQKELQLYIQRETRKVFETGDLGGTIMPGRPTSQFQVSSQFKAFSDAITYLQSTMQKGKADILGFRRMVEERWSLDPNNKALSDQAGILFELTSNTKQAAAAFEELRVSRENMGKAVDLRTGFPFRAGALSTENIGAFKDMLNKQLIDQGRMLDQYKMDLQRLYAKSPREIADATYNQAMASMAGDNSLSPSEKRFQAGLKAAEAQAEAEHKLREAQDERNRSLENLIKSSQFENTLLGETSIAVQVLRKQHELIAAVEEEATLNRTQADQKEIADIRIKMGLYKEILLLKQKYAETDRMERHLAEEREPLSTAYEDSLILKHTVEDTRQLADIHKEMARTDAERIAAAREVAAAADVVKGPERDRAIDLAGAREAATIEHERAEQVRHRRIALEQAIATQKVDLDVIGLTKGAAEALRFEFEKTQEARLEAAERGIEVDQKWIDTIKRTAEEYGKLANAIALASLQNDIMFERSQLFRTPGDQEIASRQRGAGLTVDLNSPEALAMRWNQNFKALQEGVHGFFNDLMDGLMDGEDIGEAFGKAFLNGMNKVLDDILDRLLTSISGTIADAILGTKGSGDGGGGGLLGALLTGGKDATPFAVANASGSASTAQGFMEMLSASGVGDISGSGGANALLGGSGSDLLGKLGGMTRTGIQLQDVTTQGLTAHLDARFADRFATLFSKLEAAGYPITSLGEGGYSYRNVAGTSHLSRHAFGQAVDINPRQNPQAYGARGNWSQYGVDPFQMAKESGLEYGGGWRKADTMHFQVPKSDRNLERMAQVTEQTTKSVDDLGKTSMDATKGLGDFGGGLSKFGSILSSGGGGGGGFAGGSLGGVGNFLGSLFSGGMGGGDLFGGGGAVTSIADWVQGGWHVLHEGGIAGGSGPRRFINMSARGVPRMHNGGIAGNEVPAILKRGEPVFQSMAHAQEMAGKTVINVQNYAGMDVQTKETKSKGNDTQIDILIDRTVSDKLKDGGSSSNRALREMGVRPGLRTR